MAVSGVFMNGYRTKYTQVAEDGITGTAKMKLKYFKFGELGHDGTTPKVPSADLVDIEATYEQGTAPPPGSSHISYFKKLFVAGDVSAISGSKVEVVCAMTAMEGNDDGLGNNPKYYELGIFDESDLMVAYLTFDGETKTIARGLQHTVTIDFQEE